MSAACFVCEDTGQVRITRDTKVDCAYCPAPKAKERLRGWARCGLCRGRGKVVERHMTSGGGEMVSVHNCDTCSGSGRIEL
jgi:DnaJ-class molecular chaperone